MGQPRKDTIKDIKFFLQKKGEEFSTIYTLVGNYNDSDKIRSGDYITIKCSKHNTTKTSSWGHLKRENKAPICNQCAKEKRNQEYYNKLKQICDEKGYTLIETEFVSAKSDIHYICSKHPDIVRTSQYDVLIHGHGCPECGKEKTAESCRKSDEDIKKELNKRGLDFVKTERVNGITHIYYLCRKHNDKVRQIEMSNFLNGGGCPVCRESVGERNIRNYLEDKNISFIQEWWHKECRDINPLKFDFYIPDYNLCIEFQGEQHYRPYYYNNFAKNKEEAQRMFDDTQRRDQIKRDFCKQRGIKLLEIPYQFRKTEKTIEFLDKFFKEEFSNGTQL